MITSTTASANLVTDSNIICTALNRQRLLSFAFQAPAHNRNLPSFPTRRSSDLVARDLAHRLRGRAGVEPAAGQLLARRDRKSTRLNSSHANISYAVFCLKKKSVAGQLSTEDSEEENTGQNSADQSDLGDQMTLN